MRIRWSEEAVSDYASNIDYLLEKWTKKDAQEFVDKTADTIRIISVMPKAFPVSDYKDVRKASICKQINLLYIIHKSEVILLRFWNNKQNPEKLKK